MNVSLFFHSQLGLLVIIHSDNVGSPLRKSMQNYHSQFFIGQFLQILEELFEFWRAFHELANDLFALHFINWRRILCIFKAFKVLKLQQICVVGIHSSKMFRDSLPIPSLLTPPKACVISRFVWFKNCSIKKTYGWAVLFVCWTF